MQDDSAGRLRTDCSGHLRSGRQGRLRACGLEGDVVDHPQARVAGRVLPKV